MAGNEYTHTLQPSACRCSLNIYPTAGFLTYTEYKHRLNQNEPRCLFSKLENTYVKNPLQRLDILTRSFITIILWIAKSTGSLAN